MRWVVTLLCICIMGVESWAQNDICFRVNMKDAVDRELFVPAEGDRVILRGNFCGWVGNKWVLRDLDGDGIYLGVFTLPGDPGTEIEYKYLVLKGDSTVFWEWQPEPENAPFGNRRLTLTGNAQNTGKALLTIDRYDLAAVGMPVVFTVEELQKDFARFREALEEDHCCLYEMTEKAEMDALFDQQNSLLTRPMQPHEFYMVLAPISARIGCGHSSLWMSQAYWTYAQGKLLPLELQMMDGYAVVTGYSGAEQPVPLGSIVLELDGRPMKELVAELAAEYSADAFNEHFRISQVARRFPMLYARRYGLRGAYNVNYALPGRKTSADALLRGTNPEDVAENIWGEPKLEFELREQQSLAILTINSFGYYDRVPFFTGFIDSCFQVIKKHGVRNLVLDLRGNDGGDPFCAAPLFSYLEDKPYPYFAAEYGKYARLAEPVPVAENAFRGNLITLIDGRCFSTTGHLVALLKYHGIGRLVGSETGGTYICNAATDELHLSNSRLMQFVSRSSFAAAVKNMDRKHGVQPEIEVRQHYKEYLAGRDSVMERALSLAK